MSELTYFTTPLTLLFAIALFVFCAWHSVVTLKRTNFRRSVIGLECLRLLLALIIGVTMFQPEWLTKVLPDEKPTLVVLVDESESMETKDVESSDSDDPLISRSSAISSIMDPEMLSILGRDMRVVVQPFSSSLPDSKSGTDLNEALAAAMEQNDHLRALVMVSDGSWNVGGSPSQAATSLRARNIPVFGIGVGSEIALPDLKPVSLDAPALGVVNKPTRIPFAIASTMPRESNVVVTLTSDDGVVESRNVTVPANGTLNDVFDWRPIRTGLFQLKLDVEMLANETFQGNNSISVPIEVRSESLKVLLVESFPRWEYRYLRNALSRDPGVEVSCLLYHPPLKEVGIGEEYIEQFPQTLGELSEFDVIFLGDVGVGEGQLTSEDCIRIKQIVENQATGLILMPGLRGRQFSLLDTEISALFPVVLDRANPKGSGNPTAAKLELTNSGKRSLLTKLADTEKANTQVWKGLPGFQWHAPVLRSKRGSEVLATHATKSNNSGRIPLLVTKTFGTGKILFMGTDGAWRWRQGVEDKYHYRFWGQVARWMAYRRTIAGEGFFVSPERPVQGQLVSLNANESLPNGQPLNNGDVSVTIFAPSGESETVQLAAEPSRAGSYTGSFEPRETGRYRLLLSCKETNKQTEAFINIQKVEHETIGEPANIEALREIVWVTGGEMSSIEEFATVTQSIQKLAISEPLLKRIRLWAHPIWAGVTIFLLGLFWIARKSAGLI